MPPVNRAKGPFLFAALAFVVGVAVGALVVYRSPHRGTTGADSRPGEAETLDESAARGPVAAVLPSSTGRPEAPAEAAPPVPTLATPPGSDGVHSIRRQVADAARASLGGDLPGDYLDEAERLARQYAGYQPKFQGENFARRERARRRLGELGTPWEIVVQIRTKSSRRFDLAELDEPRRGPVLSTTPLDVEQPLRPYAEDEATYVHSGVAPAGQMPILESVEVRGQFGWRPRDVGRVSIVVGNQSLANIRGRGATHTRLEGAQRMSPSFTGFGSGDVTVAVESAAVEVSFRGRWAPITSDARGDEKPLRVVLATGDAYIGPGSNRLQVLADHGGGNPHTASLDGTHNGYIRTISQRSVWDDSIELRRARESATFGSNIGLVPPGKVLRIRRIDWRARFGGFSSHSQFAVQAGGLEIVALAGPKLVGEEEAKRREQARAVVEESRSGTWTGEVLVRPGEESQTSITCSYYVLGEAVFDGELIDEPK